MRFVSHLGFILVIFIIFTEIREKIKSFSPVHLASKRLVLIFSVDKDLAGGEPVGFGAVLGPPAYRPLMFSAREENCL